MMITILAAGERSGWASAARRMSCAALLIIPWAGCSPADDPSPRVCTAPRLLRIDRETVRRLPGPPPAGSSLDEAAIAAVSAAGPPRRLPAPSAQPSPSFDPGPPAQPSPAPASGMAGPMLVPPQPLVPPQGALPAVPTAATPQAASAQALQTTRRGIASARRGALFSARADFLDALRQLAESRDQGAGGGAAAGNWGAGNRGHVTALREGLRALREADDFALPAVAWDATPDLEHVVRGHRTAVLRAAPLDRLSPQAARRRYYEFAQVRLSHAAGPGPVASLTLYSLGRLQDGLAAEGSSEKRTAPQRAMTFYRAALLSDDRNHLAANELGVLLVGLGHLSEARQVLRQAVASGASDATWHNLAVVHERLGETDLAALARREAQQAARSALTAGSAAKADVTWVASEEFARLSGGPPRAASSPGSAAEPTQPAAPRSASDRPASPPVKSGGSKSSFWPWK